MASADCFAIDIEWSTSLPFQSRMINFMTNESSNPDNVFTQSKPSNFVK